MSVPVTLPWPASLPACVQDWQEENEPVVIRTEMDGGPPKVRRRYSAPIRSITATMFLTNDQYLILRDFFDQALAGGVNYFEFTHPWSGEDLVLRFGAPPKFDTLGPLNVSVELAWQRIPT